MKQPKAQNLEEGKLLIEAEKELKRNVDELMVWLGGSIKYFVHSIKSLSELSTEKDQLRSYVTARLFDCTSQLSEIADFYIPGATSSKEKKMSEKHILKDIKKSLKGYDIDPEDMDEIVTFYTNSLNGILAENIEEFMSMRLHISALQFIAKTCNEYGSALLKYVCNHIIRTNNLPVGARVGNLLCLIMAIKEVGSTLMGDYAESIEIVLDQASVSVCMAITSDFMKSKKKEEKDGNQESGE